VSRSRRARAAAIGLSARASPAGGACAHRVLTTSTGIVTVSATHDAKPPYTIPRNTDLFSMTKGSCARSAIAHI
jgi:hypothetical protein